MKFKHKQKLSQAQIQRLQQCCGEIHEDDCIDPRRFFQPERDHKENYKGQQLCRQAFETLSLVIADCDDELMQLLNIIEVNIASDGSRLIATIQHQRVFHLVPELQMLTPEQILARLSKQVPRLRSELARSISRKRVPNLSFELDYKSDTKLEQNLSLIHI